MNEPQYKIGDHFKRIDFCDNIRYTINKIRIHKDEYIYGAACQGWADGWAWISECNMELV